MNFKRPGQKLLYYRSGLNRDAPPCEAVVTKVNSTGYRARVYYPDGTNREQRFTERDVEWGYTGTWGPPFCKVIPDDPVYLQVVAGAKAEEERRAKERKEAAALQAVKEQERYERARSLFWTLNKEGAKLVEIEHLRAEQIVARYHVETDGGRALVMATALMFNVRKQHGRYVADVARFTHLQGEDWTGPVETSRGFAHGEDLEELAVRVFMSLMERQGE